MQSGLYLSQLKLMPREYVRFNHTRPTPLLGVSNFTSVAENSLACEISCFVTDQEADQVGDILGCL